MIKREGKYKMILLLIVAVVIAVFSYMAVWLGDDINYAYSWVDQSLVSSLRDSIASQNVHYFVSNGRYVAHVIVQCFCGFLGHGWFAVANGLAYVLFMVLLCKITGITKSDDKNILMLTLIVLLSFQTKMVPSCQVGYIWMFSLSLLWLKYFFSDSKYNVWQSALLIILSLLAGNSQEAISVGISGALFFYWVENRKRMSVAQYVMMIGYWIGALSNCLAPGTIDRGTSGSLSLAAHLILCLNFFVYARATYILLGVVLYRLITKKGRLTEIYRDNKFYCNVWIILMLFNAAIGFPSNAMFGVELMSVILIFRLSPKPVFKKWFVAIIVLITLVDYSCEGFVIFKQRQEYDRILKEYKHSGTTKFVSCDKSILKSFYSDLACPPYPLELGGHEAYSRGLEAVERQRGIVPIVILPEEAVSDSCNNAVYEYSKGYWLLKQSKTKPRDFYINRTINICPIRLPIDIEPVRVDFSSDIYCEDENFTYKMVVGWVYKINKFTHIKISSVEI